jgi:eukaryotic-like serine/threonine-protein kinase
MAKMNKACSCKTSRVISCFRCITQIVRNDEGAPPDPTVNTARTEAEVKELLGDIVEEYQLVKCLGSGAMGSVYLGQNAAGHKAAIKVLRPSLATDTKILERFQREARSLRRLHHSSIVQLIKQGYSSKVGYYLVMEHLEGQTLEEHLGERKRLTVAETLEIAIQLADALSTAHQAGVVHRDLKPANIILIEAGPQVKIFDFGIAKLLRGDHDSLASAEVVLGTPAYMAPEQIRTRKDIDGRADLYALGVILFEMLTGQRPFEADKHVDLLLKHLYEPVPSPSEWVSGVPMALEALIVKCMQKEPEARYTNATLLRGALQRILPPVIPLRAPRYFSTSPEGTCIFA